MRLTTRGGQPVYAHAHVVADMDLVVRARFCGGKGGFGNMLRAQGGRMSARGKHESQDSCRDLQGRRVGSVKQAQLLAEYVAQASERQAAWDEAIGDRRASTRREACVISDAFSTSCFVALSRSLRVSTAWSFGAMASR